MRLIVNGQPADIKAATVQEVAAAMGYTGDFFAVALNRACISRKAFATTPVNEGDEVEILSPMQGG